MTKQPVEELFEIVNESGQVIGTAPRSRCHGDPALRHRAVHVLVFDRAGRIYLQKRSARKDTAPGLWDTSVGGHLQPGETTEQAARREFSEELGATPPRLHPAYSYEWSSPFETELIIAFATRYEGPFHLQADEIDDGRFWSRAEILSQLAHPVFTPQFRQEFTRMMAWWDAHHRLLEEP